MSKHLAADLASPALVTETRMPKHLATPAPVTEALTPPARKWFSRLPAIGVAVAFTMGIGTGVVFSLWSDSPTGSGISAATGDLGTTIHRGEAIWLRSTQGYHTATGRSTRFTAKTARVAVADDDNNPWGCLVGACPTANVAARSATDDTFEYPPDYDATDPLAADSPLITMPGDSFEYCLPVTTKLTGTNLAAGFKVLIGDPVVAQAVVDEQLAVEFYLALPPDSEDPGFAGPCQNLTRVAPAEDQPMAQAAVDVVSLPALIAGAGEAEPQDFTVIVHVTVLGDYLWTISDFGGANTAYWDGQTHTCNAVEPSVECKFPLGKWSAEKVDIRLVQMRGDN